MPIYALGSNSGGQLATGDHADAHTPTCTRFAHTRGSWRICGGGNHTFAWIPNTHTVFASGTNGDGELGLTAHTSAVSAVATHDPIASIACGWSHTLLLTASGNVLAAGSNAFGQRGTDSPFSQVAIPDGKAVAIAVACGMRHSVVLTSTGKAFAWGANRHGQLGIRSPPIVPRPVCISDGLPPLCQIACGRSHTVALSQDRHTVFVAGDDRFAQCGPSNPAAGLWRTFRVNARISTLSAGWEFSAVVCTNGNGAPELCMWGRGDRGQLGRSLDGAAYSRELVTADVGADEVVCGSNHVVARSGTEVWSWGWNEHGNVGDPTLANCYTPVRIDALVDGRVVGVGCGYGNTFLVTEC